MTEQVKQAVSGKKTYIICAIMFVIAGLHAIKQFVPLVQNIPDDWFAQAMNIVRGFLAEDGGGLAMALAFLRAGVKKVE